MPHADETTSGQLKDIDRVASYGFHARVIDLKVDGHRAKVSATLPEEWACVVCPADYHPTIPQGCRLRVQDTPTACRSTGRRRERYGHVCTASQNRARAGAAAT